MSINLEIINKTIDMLINLLEFKITYWEAWKDGEINYKKTTNSKKEEISLTTPLHPGSVVNLLEEVAIIPQSLIETNNAKDNNYWRIIKNIQGLKIKLDEKIDEWPETDRVKLKGISGELENPIIQRIKDIKNSIKKLRELKKNLTDIPLIQEVLLQSKKQEKGENKRDFRIEKTNFTVNDIELDEKQSDVVKHVLSEVHTILVCKGRAGTGKSTTAIASVKELVKADKRAIIISETNGSIDSLIEKLTEQLTQHDDSLIFPLRITGKKTKVSQRVKDYTLDNPSYTCFNAIISPLESFYQEKKHQDINNLSPLNQLQHEWLNSLKSKETEFPTWYLQFFNPVFCTFDMTKTLPFSLRNRDIDIVIPIPFNFLIVDNGETVPLINLMQIAHLAKNFVIFGDNKQKTRNEYQIFIDQVIGQAENYYTIYTDEELASIAESLEREKNETKKQEGNIYNQSNANKEIETTDLDKKLRRQIKKIRKLEDRHSKNMLNYSALDIIAIYKNQAVYQTELKRNYRNPCINLMTTNEKSLVRKKNIDRECNKDTSIKIEYESEIINKTFYLFDTSKIMELRAIPGKRKKTSRKNEVEGEVVIKILDKLKNRNEYQIEIAVLTPYRAQLDEVLIPKIEKLLETNVDGVSYKIDTFDSFGNRECDIALITFTISNKNEISKHFSRERIYNVLSRARQACFFIAKKDIFEEIMKKCKFDKIVDFIDKNNLRSELPYDFLKEDNISQKKIINKKGTS